MRITQTGRARSVRSLVRRIPRYVGVSLLVAVVASSVTVVRAARHESADPQYESLPASGTPGPAICPSTWPENSTPAIKRGPLVAKEPDLAVLCQYYSPGNPEVYPLAKKVTTASRAADVAQYLNNLPESDSDVVHCSLVRQAVYYAIVLQYPDRQPLTVVLDHCLAQRDAIAKPLRNPQTIMDFWNVTFSQL